MKRSILTTFLISILFISCSSKQAKSNSNSEKPQNKKMDNFKYTLQSAHPNAQALMTEDFYFSPIEETGPFGSDDGWDVAYGFREWRVSNSNTSPVTYLKELIAGWQYPFFDYNELDTAKINAYIYQNNELSEKEIQQRINTLKEVSRNSPNPPDMDDKLLRQVILSSSQDLNGTYLLGQDNAIIGIGFAQFVLEGRLDKDIKALTETAIKRQLLPLLLDRYDESYRQTRKRQLTKMLAVINKATS